MAHWGCRAAGGRRKPSPWWNRVKKNATKSKSFSGKYPIEDRKRGKSGKKHSEMLGGPPAKVRDVALQKTSQKGM